MNKLANAPAKLRVVGNVGWVGIVSGRQRRPYSSKQQLLDDLIIDRCAFDPMTSGRNYCMDRTTTTLLPHFDQRREKGREG
jgi:hypothetical protein